MECCLPISVPSLLLCPTSAPILRALLLLQLIHATAAAAAVDTSFGGGSVGGIYGRQIFRSNTAQRRMLSNAPPPPLPVWPPTTISVNMTQTIIINASNSPFDGSMKTYFGLGDGSQSEVQPPLFTLTNGSEIRNVILGPPAGDGVHCYGSCTLRNVWWADVSEDAATLMATANDSRMVMQVLGGGARYATDKVFQHNGQGTIIIRDFYAEDFGKLYRSCGDCQVAPCVRHIIMHNITIKPPFLALVGLNVNWNDSAMATNISVLAKRPRDWRPTCQLYYAVPHGQEEGPPTYPGVGDTHCLYSEKTDVVYLYGSAQQRASRGRQTWIVNIMCLIIALSLTRTHY